MNAFGANNKTFYPTPEPLIDRMIAKIKGRPNTVLEPSAGTGAIIKRMLNYVTDSNARGLFAIRPFERCKFSAIEIDPDFQAVLTSNPAISLIDTDFLQYTGRDQFDLIIANPPFDQGDLHLLKAIDIMYCGEIVFLLNAETIKNPYTNTRKELVNRLKELNAEVEYIQDAFLDAERKTSVEVALVYIRIDRKVERDLFAGGDEESARDEASYTAKQDWEVATKDTIRDLVADYEHTINIGVRSILDYYRNYNKIGKYLELKKNPHPHNFDRQDDLTGQVRATINDYIEIVRVDFWEKSLNLEEVRRRLTTDAEKEFVSLLDKRKKMDFTESNLYQFIINLINNYESIVIDAVVKVFDKLTIRHCYSGGVVDENVHYFNGWKTNNAFKVNNKVIIPIGYCDAQGRGPFTAWMDGRWRADSWQIRKNTRDIDVVMSYFDASIEYLSIADAVEYWLNKQVNKNIDSTYFKISCYKKGTMHLTFKDENILRRFNIVACRAKGWLPMDYGKKRYHECDEEEQAVIRSFEGIESYEQNVNCPLFADKRSRDSLSRLIEGGQTKETPTEGISMVA
ncbi:MAG TPA: DUF4942 domain-containing protein [Methanoregulaceae archaeon]|nr:DUF4942 domain-containing protein [Sedimentisphaerales bacterium]HPD11039.1 DUF4942 domain-containing protein [Methanoregulaceae archaeon]